MTPKSTLLLLAPRGDADHGHGVARAGTWAASFRPGRTQADVVAERLAAVPVDALYSSPLERARETAEPSAVSTGLMVNEDPGLTECDFGGWTGAALADLVGLPAWQAVQHSPSTFRFPNGESFLETQSRIVGALEGLRVP